ncbi:hypothetical protein [Mycobacterium sp.]|uniref:hypothetical protein n=1 Tax=Mycobacterium sp. TaxID=1785 RepID=UPI003F966A67
MTAQPQHDQWAAWLFQRRHGGDPELLRHHLEALAPIRDQVIANATLAPGHTASTSGAATG